LLIAIALGGTNAYQSITKEPIKESIVIDKNGKVVEPLSRDNGNLGH